MSPRRTVNLVKGEPHPSYLPAQAIAGAASRALGDRSVSDIALTYGADEGYEPFRETLAGCLSSFYRRQDISKEQVVITGGASQNLAVILQVLSDPTYTQNVWVVSPAYMLVFRTFEDHGFADRMVAVPEDVDGVDIQWLTDKLADAAEIRKSDPSLYRPSKPAHAYSKYYQHIIYCVPTFSNPSSSTMTLPRRRDLVELARRHDALIVSDDVYDFLLWPATPDTPRPARTSAHAPRLVDIESDSIEPDRFGNVISNGSFSKILAPGVRCGWAQASSKLAYALSQAGSTKSGGAPSQLTSAYLNDLVKSGWLDKHLDTLRVEYEARYHVLRQAVEEHLAPHGCRLETKGAIVGGFFLWVKLPPGLDGDRLTSLCRDKYDLEIISGRRFQVPGSRGIPHGDHVRLCFAYENVDVLAEGVQRMGLAVQALHVK